MMYLKGNSKSTQKTDASTKVVTNTTSKARDVGLTGKDAVAIVEKSATEFGNGFAQLAAITAKTNADALGFAEKALDTTDSATKTISKNLPLIIAAAGVALSIGQIFK